MSTGLLEQLADYGAYHDEHQGNLEAADIMAAPIRSTIAALEPEGVERTVWRRGVLVAFAAAALVLITVGAVAWLWPRGQGVVDQPTTTAVEETLPTQTALNWALVSWEPNATGPAWSDVTSAPWGLVGVNRGGGIWVSEDGQSWETRLPNLTVNSLSDAGNYVVLSATRPEESTSILLVSEDGSTWDELDTSILATSGIHRVQAAFPSGLLLLHHSGTNLIGIIEDTRLTDVHPSNMLLDDPSGNEAQLRELRRQLLAFKYDDKSSSSGGFVWRYLGNGEWSEATRIPIGSQYAQFNDKLYAFDHQNATCCGTEQTGPLPWRLLVSDDGVNWQEADTIEMHALYSLAVAAGDTFLIYGQQDAGGPGIRPFDYRLWISDDGEEWLEVDTSFGFEPTDSDVVVIGDFIYLVDATGRNQGISPLADGVWLGSSPKP